MIDMNTEKPSAFAPRQSIEQVEEGVDLAPKFDAAGLMPCVTTDADTGEAAWSTAVLGDSLGVSVAIARIFST